LICQRAGHVYYYEFWTLARAVREKPGKYRTERTLLKVGQFPSLEDIGASDIQKFRPVLDPADFAELHRAGGLASHGIGIGAFVYLRRTFERLIERHRDEAQLLGIKIKDFERKRMDEKIYALRRILPKTLVENRSVYGILSAGLHELDEDTCRKYFPVVRAAIVQMLEQDLRDNENKKAEEDLKRELTRINAELKETA
jgi:hypothetical protein